MADLSSYLTALLPDAPARVLLLGWPDPAVAVLGEQAVAVLGDQAGELEDAGHKLVRAAEAADLETGPGPFDAALWHGEDLGVDAGVAVGQLLRQLRDDGQVIVVAPLPADAPAASRRQGSLPSRHQTRLREIVRRLSEAGFAIRKDQDLPVQPASNGTAGWKVLLARRDPFVVRSFRDGDEAAVQRLFRASFHVDRSLDHWRWKYADNPWGGPTISLAVASDGEIVAHYGGYPLPVWYQDGDGRNAPNTFRAFQIGDTMTDPTMRNAGRGKAGLLARTVRHFFSVHRDGTFGFFYGFNTGPIQRFCRWFIGGSQDRPVRYLARDLDPAPGWQSDGYRIERIETVGPAFDRLFRRAAPSYRFLVQRDAQYLDWRYRRRPDVRYVILAARRFRRLVGWSVFLRRDDPLVPGAYLAWGDALFHPRHCQAAEPILAAALAEPELAGAQRVDAWFSGGPPRWDEQLAKLGFVTRPEPQGLGMIALADTEPGAFDRLGEMYTTMGDGDLF